jgi:hypothetical protein
MSEIKKQFKFFWPWQDQKQEKWLEEQSKNGFHLKKPNNLIGIYTFETGAPEDFIYRLDFQSDLNDKNDAYIQLFEDAGWEYLGESSWQYFRKSFEEDANNEIFTDNQSKLSKYNRLVWYQGIILAVLTALFVDGGDLEGNIAWISQYLFPILYFPVAIISILSIVKILNRINDLKQEVKD